ncbi:hypothetical protein [Moritella sp. F3]|uniref:hypothetical protein n=1 Tax=Moritella sp. F3 TaxID=2718882 RepID=UPI0018E0E737|nr:hypothetical protein [Moritella sp. F3]GIC77078.1 hypothetical protein FMO001_18050 [Moritella sp. F1]GIC82197.1 hypothetical protein FMO003_24780 [Moritella sp. F3]
MNKHYLLTEVLLWAPSIAGKDDNVELKVVGLLKGRIESIYQSCQSSDVDVTIVSAASATYKTALILAPDVSCKRFSDNQQVSYSLYQPKVILKSKVIEAIDVELNIERYVYELAASLNDKRKPVDLILFDAAPTIETALNVNLNIAFPFGNNTNSDLTLLEHIGISMTTQDCEMIPRVIEQRRGISSNYGDKLITLVRLKNGSLYWLLTHDDLNRHYLCSALTTHLEQKFLSFAQQEVREAENLLKCAVLQQKGKVAAEWLEMA